MVFTDTQIWEDNWPYDRALNKAKDYAFNVQFAQLSNHRDKNITFKPGNYVQI